MRAGLGVFLGIMFVSMLADTIDVQELATGRRQEGVFAAALSFSGKATAGLGTVVAGFLLQEVVHWPAHVDPRAVDPHDGHAAGPRRRRAGAAALRHSLRLRLFPADHPQIPRTHAARNWSAGAPRRQCRAEDQGALAEGLEVAMEAASEAIGG